MDNPEYVSIDGKKYKINTDFRTALKCIEASKDKSISQLERNLSILYLIYGDEGINNTDIEERLLESALKYLSCGSEYDENDKKNKEPDMDFMQDWKLLVSSFRSDYGLDITKEKIHWWTFYMLVCGLSNECILNRVREIRNTKLSEIKDAKQKEKMKELKRIYALKTEPVELTEEQQRSVDKFYELTGIGR